MSVQPSKRDLERAREIVKSVKDGTSTDEVIKRIAAALAEQRERDARIVEGAACKLCCKDTTAAIRRGEA